MQDFHYNRARALLANAEEIVSADQVQAAVRHVAEVLNQRFDNDETSDFPLVLGVMGGAVVFCARPIFGKNTSANVSTSAGEI